MKSFKQYIIESEQFVPGVYKDGEQNYSIDRLIKHTQSRTPTKVPVMDIIKNNSSLETKEGNFKVNLETPSEDFKKRVDRANTQFPLLVHSSGWIIDGSHRLAKLHRSGETHADVHFINDEDLKHGIITSDEELKKSSEV